MLLVAVEPLRVPAVLVVHLVCAVRDSAGGLVARARRAVRAAAGEDGLDVEEEAAQLLQLAPLRLTPRRHRPRAAARRPMVASGTIPGLPPGW